MRVIPRVTSALAPEPVTLAQLRAHVIADDDVDDTLLRGFLLAATAAIEAMMGRPIGEQVVTATFEGWPTASSPCYSGGAGIGWNFIELLMPVNAVTGIAYTDPTGTTVPWADFVARQTPGGTMRVRPKAGTGWPELGPDPLITLTATAGFETVPEPIVTAVMKLAGHLYADRDGIGDRSMGYGRMPEDIRALVRPWRWIWIG